MEKSTGYRHIWHGQILWIFYMILLHFLIHDLQCIVFKRFHGSRSDIKQRLICYKTAVTFGCCVSISLSHACSTPVGAGIVADLAFFSEFFHDFNQFPGRNCFIISVIKININIINKHISVNLSFNSSTKFPNPFILKIYFPSTLE